MLVVWCTRFRIKVNTAAASTSTSSYVHERNDAILIKLHVHSMSSICNRTITLLEIYLR